MKAITIDKRAIIYTSIFTALMVLDVLLSSGVIAGKNPLLFEGNPVAKFINVKALLVLKLVAATGITIYFLKRKDYKAMKFAAIAMSILTIWNVIMLFVANLFI